MVMRTVSTPAVISVSEAANVDTLAQGGYVGAVAKRHATPSNVPALAEYQTLETRWKAEADEWLRGWLDRYFATDGAYEHHTAGDILKLIDSDPSMPTGWARLVKSETGAYNERYNAVRNRLEGLARAKRVVCSTTINAKGKSQSTTYARPRDVSSEWAIEVDGAGGDKATEAARLLREFLAERGATLEGLEGILLTRKAGGSNNAESSTRPVKGRGKRSGGKRKGAGDADPDRTAGARGGQPAHAAGTGRRQRRRTTGGD